MSDRFETLLLIIDLSLKLALRQKPLQPQNQKIYLARELGISPGYSLTLSKELNLLLQKFKTFKARALRWRL